MYNKTYFDTLLDGGNQESNSDANENNNYGK